MTLILFLAVVVFLLVRSGELRIWHVVVVGLLGLELDRSRIAESIITAVVQVFQVLTNAH
ncbi:hypothetical protein [Streptacidiphilus sp. MAP5-3]|uniref:hypothetical protein n=1 Tax=unclassified Streptacidiphilus TaxID=2643834 RepID=UPI0035136DFA